MNILVVDDHKINRDILVSYLCRKGHNVLQAESGADALKLCKESMPDIILMDIMMPGLNGYDTVRSIREIESELHVPVIFITAIKAEEGMQKAIDSGGDDYITKPVNLEILDAKLNSHMRVQKINQQLSEVIHELRIYNQKLFEEQQLVDRIFSHALSQSCFDSSFISYKNRPCEEFDGDVILAEKNPAGNLYVLVGDFTGHGLHAAVGALPVCQIFFSMTRKGESLAAIIAEINTNLKMLFPPNMFMCASFVQIDQDAKRIKLWAGGLPVVVLSNAVTGEQKIFSSQHMPLGILDRDEFDDSVEEIEFVDGDYLYLCSDGIPETKNYDKDEYGVDRLLSKLVQPHNDVLEEVFRDVDNFRGDVKQEDDMTLVEVDLNRIITD